VRVAKTYQEIIQSAFEAQTDLVIMACEAAMRWTWHSLVSTMHRVIQLGSSPVLAVHI
jgi:hypothetical protein